MQNDWLELQLFEKSCRISCDFRIMPVNNKYFACRDFQKQVAERIIQIWRKA
jgi:hypothetical protein